ncbi:MAG: general secretion pathway protein G [Myxococcota bacterium]|jgi:general secretion pathway protein G
MLRNRLQYRNAADSGRSGMTLVEIIVVIAIILVLTSILAFGIFSVFGQAKADAAKVQMSRLDSRIQIYMARNGSYPSGGDGLAAAVAPDEVPNDPWGNPYRYVVPGGNGKPYDIVSLGSDGAEGGTGEAADLRLSDR